MPCCHHWPRARAIRVEAAEPPPADVDGPDREKCVIDEQTAAPVQTDYFVGLTCGVEICRVMAPVVIELLCANKMTDEKNDGDGP